MKRCPRCGEKPHPIQNCTSPLELPVGGMLEACFREPPHSFYPPRANYPQSLEAVIRAEYARSPIYG